MREIALWYLTSKIAFHHLCCCSAAKEIQSLTPRNGVMFGASSKLTFLAVSFCD